MARSFPTDNQHRAVRPAHDACTHRAVHDLMRVCEGRKFLLVLLFVVACSSSCLLLVAVAAHQASCIMLVAVAVACSLVSLHGM